MDNAIVLSNGERANDQLRNLARRVPAPEFEHPEVKAVVINSLKPRIFCAGANIYMLGASSHARKVNF